MPTQAEFDRYTKTIRKMAALAESLRDIRPTTQQTMETCFSAAAQVLCDNNGQVIRLDALQDAFVEFMRAMQAVAKRPTQNAQGPS